jgi:hypothetical protein
VGPKAPTEVKCIIITHKAAKNRVEVRLSSVLGEAGRTGRGSSGQRQEWCMPLL